MSKVIQRGISMENKLQFSEILRTLRKVSDFSTLEKLAEEVNVTRQTLGYYEKGERIPDIDTLEKLADVFGVSCDYLLGRTVISQRIGLSRGAIRKLETDCLLDEPDYTKILSKLIEHENLAIFCKVIDNYIVEDEFKDDVAESFIAEASDNYSYSFATRDFLVSSLYKNLANEYLWEMVNDMKTEKKVKSKKKEDTSNGK